MELNLRFVMCLQYLILQALLLSIPIPLCSASEIGCLEEGSRIIDGVNGTLISRGEEFELGFFSPDKNNSRSRYLGIWYYRQSNPKIVVWVANRDKPLLETNGYLVINDSFAKVLDTKGIAYWLTNSVLPETQQGQHLGAAKSDFRYNNYSHQYHFNPINVSSNATAMTKLTRLCLQDDGNLVLHRRDLVDLILWQSFNDPTDTFLPGMNAAQGSLNLTSWRALNNPALGRYVFTMQQGQQPADNGNKFAIRRAINSALHWESGDTPFDQTPQALLFLLLKNNSQLKDYQYSRLVMNFTGQIQFWNRESKRGNWSLIWREPKDECGLYEACGTLGSCNSNNGFLCKCLPGSDASNPGRWNSRDFSKGCSLRSETCHRMNISEDVFLRMPMMKVKAPRSNETNVPDCKGICRSDCTCLAYSCGVSDCSRSDEKRCLIWSFSELTGLREEYSGGLTIFVRATHTDIDLTSRGCWPCGAYIIPYPLSTAANCGDSSYHNFICNSTTGQVYFSTGNLTYRVTSLDPKARNFTIQVGHGDSCGSNFTGSFALPPKYSLLYHVLKCKVVNDPSFIEVGQSYTEVEMSWKPPSEPACKTSSDCHDWPHTTCKKRGGKRSCICNLRFRWDGINLICTEVTFFKVLIPCVAGALAIILISGIICVYRNWKRRSDKLQGFVDLNVDTESTEVPYFNWEAIIAATNNFADAYKLGRGGFGSVYRGKLPDGQEIAVKRLSSISVQGLEEFRTEVKLIAKLQHRNLVKLVGYCMKADEKILVYEYMPNGSLDSCLFDERHSVYLDWKKRFDIILGIARGLLYLHQDSRLRIIHRDLKPSNILLDEELNPKISDFGIARIVGGKETEASTKRVVGTYGYMSPEYAYEGIFSVKSDVFSFGVVVLETISGRRNSKIFMFEHGLSLLGHAWKLWNEDKGLELMDSKLNESCFPSEVLKCIHIGLLCVQEDPSDRPTMSTVVHMLSGENASLPLAKQPAFMNRKPLSENASSSSAMDSSVHEEMTVSTIGR